MPNTLLARRRIHGRLEEVAFAEAVMPLAEQLAEDMTVAHIRETANRYVIWTEEGYATVVAHIKSKYEAASLEDAKNKTELAWFDFDPYLVLAQPRIAYDGGRPVTGTCIEILTKADFPAIFNN